MHARDDDLARAAATAPATASATASALPAHTSSCTVPPQPPPPHHAKGCCCFDNPHAPQQGHAVTVDCAVPPSHLVHHRAAGLSASTASATTTTTTASRLSSAAAAETMAAAASEISTSDLVSGPSNANARMRQLPPGAAYAPQHAPSPRPIASTAPPGSSRSPAPRTLLDSPPPPVNYSRPIMAGGSGSSPSPSRGLSESARPTLDTRRSLVGPSSHHHHPPAAAAAASSLSSLSAPALLPAPSSALPSTSSPSPPTASSGLSLLIPQLPVLVPAPAFSPEDRGPYPPLGGSSSAAPAAAPLPLPLLDGTVSNPPVSSSGWATMPPADLAGVGTHPRSALGASSGGGRPRPQVASSPTTAPNSTSPAAVPASNGIGVPRPGASTPARSPTIVGPSIYASAPAASAALVSAVPFPFSSPSPSSLVVAQSTTPQQQQQQSGAADSATSPPPPRPPAPSAAPMPAPPPPAPPLPPHLVPQPEVCVECRMRDRDMADVDVTGPGVWDRLSDAEWEEQLRWEEETQPALGAGADTVVDSPSGGGGGGGGHASSSSESGFVQGGSGGGGVRRSVYERESSSAHTGPGGPSSAAGGRRRFGKGQRLTSGNLQVWTTMTPPAAAHRWRTLQTFLLTQAHYLELDRQARLRESSSPSPSPSYYSGGVPPGGPSLSLDPGQAVAPRPRATSLLLSPAPAHAMPIAEPAALEYDERATALRPIQSRSRATLPDELHPYPATSITNPNQSFRHSSASLLSPSSLYNGGPAVSGLGAGVGVGVGAAAGNVSSGSSMRSYSAGDQPWLGTTGTAPALRRLSSPSPAAAAGGGAVPVGGGGSGSQRSSSPPRSPATSFSFSSGRFAFPKFARSTTDLRSLPSAQTGGGGGGGAGGTTTPRRSVSPARTSGDGSRSRRPTSMWSRFRQSASAASVLSFAPSGSLMDMHLGLEQDQKRTMMMVQQQQQQQYGGAAFGAAGSGYGSLGPHPSHSNHYHHYQQGGPSQFGAAGGGGGGGGMGSATTLYDLYGAAMSDPAVARHADRRERERVLAETAAAAAAAAREAEGAGGGSGSNGGSGAGGKKKKKGLKGFFNKLVGGGGGGGGRGRSHTLGSASAPPTPGLGCGGAFDASLGSGAGDDGEGGGAGPAGGDDDELAPPPPLSALANEPRYHHRSGSTSSIDSFGPYTPPLPPAQHFRQSYHMPLAGGGGGGGTPADRQSVLTLGSFTSTRSNGNHKYGGGGAAGGRPPTEASRHSWVGRPSLDSLRDQTSLRRPGSFVGTPAAAGGAAGGGGDAETEVLTGAVDHLDLDPVPQQGDDAGILALGPPQPPRAQKSLPLLPTEAMHRAGGGPPHAHGASAYDPWGPYGASTAYDDLSGPPAHGGGGGLYGNYGASRSAHVLGSSQANGSRTSLGPDFGFRVDDGRGGDGAGARPGPGDEPHHTVRKARSRAKVFSLSFGSKKSARPPASPSPPPPPIPMAGPVLRSSASFNSSTMMRGFVASADERGKGSLETLSPSPAGFPSNIQYLTTPVASPLLSAEDRLTYCSPCPPHLDPNPPPRVAIRVITDPRHPARGQRGLFYTGTTDLERGTWIRDYVGWVHLEAEADPASGYDLSLERRRRHTLPPGGDELAAGDEDPEFEVVGCDATRMGGEARFVNDYRGVPGFERPNAVFDLRTWDLPGGREGVRMAVWAGPHGVPKGSEICVSYGRGYWQPRASTGGSGMEEQASSAPKPRVGRGKRVAKSKKQG